MKLNSVLTENIIKDETHYLTENDKSLITEANEMYDNLISMLEDVSELRNGLAENVYEANQVPDIHIIINEMLEEISQSDYNDLLEKVERQFRRYSGEDTLRRQYRCTTGPKAGRIVPSPEKCGIRKDPRRVRIGKKASRVKKGQRVRKSLFTKRKSTSKRLQRLNKVQRGDN